jgi:hypothetical protein
MAERQLQTAQVHPRIQEMTREGMPERISTLLIIRR